MLYSTQLYRKECGNSLIYTEYRNSKFLRNLSTYQPHLTSQTTETLILKAVRILNTRLIQQRHKTHYFLNKR
jgi:hypothetical protein